MIQNKKVLAIIPARGGSKGVPRKNIRVVAGKPLIAWTIEEAKKSKYIDRVVLSSDDDEIMRVAEQFGCEAPFKRPVKLAQDSTPGVDPILHALEAVPGYDYIVLLQPTSPLRTVEDIDGAIEKCLQEKAPVCVSITLARESPYYMFTLSGEGSMHPLLQGNTKFDRRQDLPKVYVLNGAVYVAETGFLKDKKLFLTPQTTPYVMPNERSLDIDTELDLIVLEAAFKAQFAQHQSLKDTQ